MSIQTNVILLSAASSVVLTLSAVQASPANLHVNQDEAKRAFNSLAQFVGSWEGTDEEGNATRLEYTLTARNTVLIERWIFASGPETLTQPVLSRNASDAHPLAPGRLRTDSRLESQPPRMDRDHDTERGQTSASASPRSNDPTTPIPEAARR